MRTKQKRKCWACSKPTENFKRIKAIKNYVKKFECSPKCFTAMDIERTQSKIAKTLSKPSPFYRTIE